MYFFLKEPKSNKATLIYLIYYLKSEGKNFKYSTGQKVHPGDWNFEDRMPKSKRGAGGVISRHLSTVLSQYSTCLDDVIKDCEKENKALHREFLKIRFEERFNHKETKKDDKGVVSAVQDFIDAKNMSMGQSDSWNQKYQNLKMKLEYFQEHKGRTLIFTDINQDWLDEYCGFLRTINKKPFKPHNDNTLHRNINFLFTFLHWSAEKYHKINLSRIKNQVKTFQPDDVFLTTEEVSLLEKIELHRDSLNRARDLFLVGVYSGQRFSDYSVFEKADLQGDMIIKRAEKTESDSFIPLHPKLKAILDKYEWNLPAISSQKFNKNIQEVCKIAEIDEPIKETVYRGTEKQIIYHSKYKMVASHTARRTFITLSSERGMPDHIIMKITGIKDPKTLLKYKKTSQKSVVESMNKYWS